MIFTDTLANNVLPWITFDPAKNLITANVNTIADYLVYNNQ